MVKTQLKYDVKKENNQNIHEEKTKYYLEPWDILSQAAQVLNLESNSLDDNQNLKYLLDKFNKVLAPNTDDTFKNSISNSMDLIDKPSSLDDKMKALVPGSKRSFLIVPLFSNDHAFSVVLFKDKDGIHSTIVNKGGGSEDNGQYTTFIIDDNKLSEILKNVLNEDNNFSTKDIYENFFKEVKPSSRYTLSRRQKTGNCFIKEIEQAIKCAYTLSSDTNKDFEKAYKPTWPMSTEKIHNDYINQIKKDYPELRIKLNKALEIYEKNKHFRNYIESGITPYRSLKLAFDPTGSLNKEGDPSAIKIMLKDITVDTFAQHRKEVIELLTKARYQNYSISKLENLYRGISLDEFKSSMLNEVKNNFPQIESFMRRKYNDEFRNRAFENFENSNYYKTLEDAGMAIGLNPRDYLSYYIRAYTYKRMENYDKALENCNEMIKLKPKKTHFYKLRSSLYEKLKQYNDAIKDYNKIIGLDSEDISAYKSRSSLYEKLEQYNDAIKDYNKVIELDSKDISSYESRISLYEKLGQYKNAINDYNTIIKLNGQNIDAYYIYRRGIMNKNLDDKQEALNDFNQVIALDITEPSDYVPIGLSYLELKKFDKSIAVFTEAIGSYKGNENPYIFRSVANSLFGKEKEANADLNEAIKILESEAEGYHKRGSIYFMMGNYKEALADFQQALKFEPNNVEFKNSQEEAREKLQKEQPLKIANNEKYPIGKDKEKQKEEIQNKMLNKSKGNGISRSMN